MPRETLGERLTRHCRADHAAADTPDTSHLDAWAAVVTQDDRPAFDRRLEWDELTPSRAVALVATPAGAPAAWMLTLVEAWERAANTTAARDATNEPALSPVLVPRAPVRRRPSLT